MLVVGSGGSCLVPVALSVEFIQGPCYQNFEG